MKLKRIFLTCFFSACLLTISLNISITSTAQEPTKTASDVTWTAENSDPNVLGWMQGSPPPLDKIIRFDDNSFAKFPQWRWTVCNFQQLMPTKPVSRRLSSVAQLESKEVPSIDDVTFIPLGAKDSMTWKQSLAANFTDGILVMHHGKVVYETYAGCLAPVQTSWSDVYD